MDPRGVSIQPQGGREADLKTTALALTAAGRPGVVSGWRRARPVPGPPRLWESPGLRGPDPPSAPRTVEHSLHMFDRMVIYFFIAASYAPW